MRGLLRVTIALFLLWPAVGSALGATDAVEQVCALLQPPHGPSVAPAPGGSGGIELAQSCRQGMGLCPGGSTCCPLGTLCTADGYCMQPGRVYCGGGRSCQAGRICTNCADGLRCTTDGRCRAAAVDPNCTQWSRQLDGSYFRVCVDNRGMRYCERAANNVVSRVGCQ